MQRFFHAAGGDSAGTSAVRTVALLRRHDCRAHQRHRACCAQRRREPGVLPIDGHARSIGRIAGQNTGKRAHHDVAAAALASGWLREHLRVRSGGEDCSSVKSAIEAAQPADGRAVIELRFECPRMRGQLELDDSLAKVFGDHYRSILGFQRVDGRREERVLQEQMRNAKFDLGTDADPRYWLG
jgi:hypothetical protein